MVWGTQGVLQVWVLLAPLPHATTRFVERGQGAAGGDTKLLVPSRIPPGLHPHSSLSARAAFSSWSTLQPSQPPWQERWGRDGAKAADICQPSPHHDGRLGTTLPGQRWELGVITVPEARTVTCKVPEPLCARLNDHGQERCHGWSTWSLHPWRCSGDMWMWHRGRCFCDGTSAAAEGCV